MKETLIPIPLWFFDSMVQRGSLNADDIPSFPTANPSSAFPPYSYYNDPNFALILTYGNYDLIFYNYLKAYMMQLIPATDAIEATGNTLTIA